LDQLRQAVGEARASAAARQEGSAAGPRITPSDLPDRLHARQQAAVRPVTAEETIVLDEFLARVEREVVRRALSQAKGNKAQAARLLGLTRPRLYRRMEQLGLESD
jgi:DNA-binding NtrC family response regulator